MNTYRTIVNNNEYIISVSELNDVPELQENNVACDEISEYYCDLIKHILLCIFTLGIWAMIWVYRTTILLNKSPDAEYYNPTKQLLLYIFIPFYSVFWIYKHAQRIDGLSKKYGVNSDISIICLILGIFVPIAAILIMQDKINAICLVSRKN
ncbi:MAG: DUF4234 domain-containing protein [Clostridia bacterium]|nr:DUF4234 domain-containing protein [Clostridia bacterium]